MPYESESEAFHKSKKLKEQERLKQGFKPTGFPPSPPASPAKGAPAFCSFKGRKPILERQLNMEADKIAIREGVRLPSPPPRCNICEGNSHISENCWSVNPWICPEWFLRKWIKRASPTTRHPSRAVKANWPPIYIDRLRYNVVSHSYHYLLTVLEKRQELAGIMERQELADQPTSEPTNPHSPIVSNPSNLNSPEIVQSKRTRFKIVATLRDFQTVLENL